MPNNTQNNINPKKKISYGDIKKMVEEVSENKHLDDKIEIHLKQIK